MSLLRKRFAAELGGRDEYLRDASCSNCEARSQFFISKGARIQDLQAQECSVCGCQTVVIR